MYLMRPEISDETEEAIRQWIEDNPDKGISSVGPAIDYLVPKGIKRDNFEEGDLTKEEVEAVREALNQGRI